MSPAARQRAIAILLPALVTLVAYGVVLGRTRTLAGIKARQVEAEQAVARAESQRQLAATRERIARLEARRDALLAAGHATDSGQPSSGLPSAGQPSAGQLSAAQASAIVARLGSAGLRVEGQQVLRAGAPGSTAAGGWAFDLAGEYVALLAVLDAFAAGELPGAPMRITLDGVTRQSSERRIHLEVSP